jgi:hypothetical protein
MTKRVCVHATKESKKKKLSTWLQGGMLTDHGGVFAETAQPLAALLGEEIQFMSDLLFSEFEAALTASHGVDDVEAACSKLLFKAPTRATDILMKRRYNGA